MKWIAVCVVAVIVSAGCSKAGPRKFTGPDGRDSYSISCFRSLAGCYESAETLCKEGYDVIDRTAVVIDLNVQRNNLLIACK